MGEMQGRRYLLGDEVVEVLVQWRTGNRGVGGGYGPGRIHEPVGRLRERRGPQNLLVRRADGRLEVRSWWRGARVRQEGETIG